MKSGIQRNLVVRTGGAVTIPHALKRIFGPHAPAIQSLVDADPGLADFVSRQDRAGVHFLSLAVSFRMPDSPAGRRKLAEALRSQPRARLLRLFLSGKPPAGLIRVLSRLGAAPMPAESYRLLLSLMQEPQARKVLTHEKKISRRMLDGLNNLPPAIRMPRLARIAGRTEDCERLSYALAAVRRLRQDLDDSAIRNSLKAVQEADDVFRWLEHMLSRCPFAAPPWDGDGELTLVRNRQQLREAAKRFNNCLASHHMTDAVLGRKFFYVWEGAEPCVAEICRDDLVGWRLGEVEGADNTAPDPDVRAAIAARFAALGIADFGRSGNAVWDEFL